MKFLNQVKYFIPIVFMCFSVSCKSKDNPVADSGKTTSQTVVERFGNIHVKGNRVVDKNDSIVALNGMSLFWSQWGGGFYNAQCINWLKDDWKCTVVRAACGVESGGYLSNPQVEMTKIITVIDACINAGIYVIVDWHDHNAQNHQTEAIQFFSAISQKYAGKQNIIYEIYNEPLQVSWSNVIKPYAVAVIKEIRKYSPNNLIVVGNPNWSQDVDVASKDPIVDNNVAYSFHFYTSTHKQSLRDKAITAMNNGAALFVTEYGISEASGAGIIDYTETAKWFAFTSQYKLSCCNWSIIDKNETSAALKPGAAVIGSWKESELSTSGTYIRNYLRSLNSTL